MNFLNLVFVNSVIKLHLKFIFKLSYKWNCSYSIKLKPVLLDQYKFLLKIISFSNKMYKTFKIKEILLIYFILHVSHFNFFFAHKP